MERYRRRQRPSGDLVVDFDLSAEELATLDSPDTGVQGGPEPMPLDEIFEVSRWCIAMQAMRAVPLSGLQ